MDRPKFVIVGGGLGGALAACYLGKAGYSVEVYELRDDLRKADVGRGRSINPRSRIAGCVRWSLSA